MKANKTKKILILGAGFGGLRTFLRLQKLLRLCKDVEITLVNNTNYFLFTPFLHEVATARLQAEDIIEPLGKFVSHKNASVEEAEVKKISVAKHTVTTSEREMSFDYLVVALGATNNFYGIPRAKENSYTLKTLSDAVKIKNHFIDIVTEGKPLDIAIIGGGATGIELAAETADFFHYTLKKYFPAQLQKQKLNIVVIEQSQNILPGFSERIQNNSLKLLQQKGVRVMTGTTVKKIKPGEIHTDKKNVKAETVIWTAGIAPVDVAFDGKNRNERGCFVVDKYLTLGGKKNIFVIGDIAWCMDEKTQKPIPHLAQSALQQANIAAENIFQALQHKPLRPFTYNPLGQLVSLGEKEAVGEISRLSFHGRVGGWLWHLIHLSKMLSWEKRVNILVQWLWRSFSARDISKF